MPKVIDDVTYYTQSELDAAVDGVKAVNKALKDEKKELADKVKEFEDKAHTAAEEAAKAAGDYEKLLQLERDRRETESKRAEQLQAQIKKEKTMNAINDLVTGLGAGGKHNEDLRDLIKARYEVDYDIETGAVKVLGEGASTIDELKKTILESGRYDAYLAGSKASGGGATGQGGQAKKSWSDMSEAEQVQLYNMNKDEALRLMKQSI